MLWFLLAILLSVSGVISGSETALFGLNRQTLHAWRRSHRPLQRQAYWIMQRPRRALMTVLMVNTATNVAIFTISFFTLRQISDASVAIGSAFVVLCVIVFGEMVPKTIAFSNPNLFAPAAAGLIGTVQFVFGPFQWLLANLLIDPITRLLAPGSHPAAAVSVEELRMLVEHSAEEGTIDTIENDMLRAIVALGEVSVREIMTPRVDIISVRLEDRREKVEQTLREARRRRIPVCGKDLDDVRGVLRTRDLYLSPDKPLSELVLTAHFVPEQIRLGQLLQHFRTEGIHMAMVVDEFGGTAGLVTSEDVIEWIVGDLPDAETPQSASPTERIDENTYRLSGDLSARVWADRFGVDEIDHRIDTVGGLILSRLGHLAHIGETVRIRNLTLTVESMRGRRIDRVILRHLPDADKGTEATA